MSVQMRSLIAMSRPFLPRVFLASLLGAASILGAVGLMGSSAFLISRAALHRPIMELGLAIVGVRFFALARVGSRYLERLVSHDVALRYLTGVRTSVYRRLIPRAPGVFDTMHSGDVLSRVVRDVDELQFFFLRGVLPPVIAVFTTIVVVAFLWAILPVAAVIMVFVAVVSGIVVPEIASRLAHRSARSLVAVRATSAVQLADMIHGHGELVAFGALEERLREFSRHQGELRRCEQRVATTAGFAAGLQLFFSLVALGGVLAAGAVARSHGAISAESLAALGFAVFAACEAYVGLPMARVQMSSVREAARRVDELTHSTPESAGVRFVEALPQGEVALDIRDVAVSYASRSQPAIRGVSVHVEPGECVGLVGPSGHGKTTLLDAIVGFRPLADGQITLGGVDVAALSEADLRSAIGYVADDGVLFTATLRENMRLARPDVTTSELDSIAKRLGLAELIRQLPNGWDTRVTDDGAQFSGGQRRRLLLMRALVTHPKVLLVDEPTTGLDDETAMRIIDDLVQVATQDHIAVLLATHHSKSLGRMHRIVRIRDGALKA